VLLQRERGQVSQDEVYYNSERRRHKSNVKEDKSYRGGVQHLREEEGRCRG